MNALDFVHAAQEIKIQITDSINAGENPAKILLEVAKWLSDITGEQSFYNETYQQLLAIQGLALEDKFLLETELAEVKTRLKKIQAAYQDESFTEEEHKRMHYAIERHKQEIERLCRINKSSN